MAEVDFGLRVAVFRLADLVVFFGAALTELMVGLADLEADLMVFVDLVDLVVFLGVVWEGLEREAEILLRRVASPSIDLFLSIVYNYNIWQ